MADRSMEVVLRMEESASRGMREHGSDVQAQAERDARQRERAAERVSQMEQRGNDRAQRAVEEAVQARLDADPQAAELRKQLDGVRAQIRELATKANGGE